MKKIKCNLCGGTWIVEDEDLNHVKVCPFCSANLQGKIEFDAIDSLDKLIYSIVCKLGIESFQNMNQFSAYMMDLAPNLKKETRIFTRTVTSNYTNYVIDAFNQDISSSQFTINKLKYLFTEEEGLSDSWADMICQSISSAVSFYQGQGTTQLINVHINDFSADYSIPEIPKSSDPTEIQQNPKLDLSLVTKMINDKSQSGKKVISGTGSDTLEVSKSIQYEFEFINDICDKKLWDGDFQINELQESGTLEAILSICESWYFDNINKAYVTDVFDFVANQYSQVYPISDASVLNILGCYYLNLRQYDKSFTWYKQSSELGNCEALCMMGYFYSEGLGQVELSISEALHYYQSAANSKESAQLSSIANKFLSGDTLPKNEDVGIDILFAGYATLNSNALYLLGQCYENGKGIKKSMHKAIDCYAKASKYQRNENASYALQRIKSSLTTEEKEKYKLKG